ncbi:MAG: sugar ABC transporter permease [Planctomycetota bacterium]
MVRYLFLLPALILLGLVIYFPIVRCIELSLSTEEEPLLINYEKAVNDERFHTTLWNTCTFTAFSLSAEMIIGLLMALCLNIAFKGKGLVRAVVLIPWALPPAVMAMGWRWIYNDIYGVASDMLVCSGITTERIAWLGTPALAMFSIYSG